MFMCINIWSKVGGIIGEFVEPLGGGKSEVSESLGAFKGCSLCHFPVHSLLSCLPPDQSSYHKFPLPWDQLLLYISCNSDYNCSSHKLNKFFLLWIGSVRYSAKESGEIIQFPHVSLSILSIYTLVITHASIFLPVFFQNESLSLPSRFFSGSIYVCLTQHNNFWYHLFSWKWHDSILCYEWLKCHHICAYIHIQIYIVVSSFIYLLTVP